MKDKDTLVQNMIRVCKADLEGIGLEITTMNIADVDDHRLDGMQDPQLYIDLLKRIQATNAETQSREAQAEASAVASEEAQERRADVEVRDLNNERKQLLAETRVRVATERDGIADCVVQIIALQKAKNRLGHGTLAGHIKRVEGANRVDWTRQFVADLLVDKLSNVVRCNGSRVIRRQEFNQPGFQPVIWLAFDGLEYATNDFLLIGRELIRKSSTVFVWNR